MMLQHFLAVVLSSLSNRDFHIWIAKHGCLLEASSVKSVAVYSIRFTKSPWRARSTNYEIVWSTWASCSDNIDIETSSSAMTSISGWIGAKRKQNGRICYDTHLLECREYPIHLLKDLKKFVWWEFWAGPNISLRTTFSNVLLSTITRWLKISFGLNWMIWTPTLCYVFWEAQLLTHCIFCRRDMRAWSLSLEVIWTGTEH